jgi:hypothetical protein
MDDMTEFLDSHEIIEVDCFWLADSIDVVSREIDQHNVLCSIFVGCGQLST